ncbi:MAG: aryl-sulfate sulfotransferase [candidate division Zixibacteria bacterium]|nr:aryl-sulfate sulfotransferase [candidate division Zixibacteria bacterium]
MQRKPLPVNRKKATSILILILAFVPFSAQAQTVGLFEYDPGSFNGYTLLAPSPSTTTYLIDNYGRVVHKWESSYIPALSAYLLENGNLLRTIKFDIVDGTGAGFEELAWDGTVIWHYEHYGDTYRQHHDIEPLPNGNVLVLSREHILTADAIAAGRDPSTLTDTIVSPEYIAEIEPIGPTTGNIVWEWHLWDHLVQDFDSTKPNFGVVANHPELVDLNYTPTSDANWIHGNAVDYNPELDQIVVSSRLFNEFWVIDHSTTSIESSGHTGGDRAMGGDILFRWGNPQTYRAGTADDQRLFGQHDVHWIGLGLSGEGHFLLFNNGLNRPDGKYSTVDEILSPVDGTGQYPLPTGGAPHEPADQLWIYEPDPLTSLYSPTFSGAQRLPNGNTLICSGRKGIIVEIDASGQEVWRYINPEIASGPLEQGQTVPAGQNSVFKIRRYAQDYPGLAGRELIPGAPVETYPISISGTSHLPAEPTEDDSVIVTATITDDIAVTTAELRVDMGYGPFTMTMFDDGNHHDGSAGDDLYGAVIPPLHGSGSVSYYVYAENDPGSATNDPTIAPVTTYNYAVSGDPSVCGDADASGDVDIDDVVYLIAYIFSGGPAPDPLESGDADCSGEVDIDDVVYLIAYIFSGGNPPCDADGDAVPDC